MTLQDDNGNELFTGKVFYNERTNEQGTIQITCYDDGIRLSNSSGTFNFKGKTAEAIAQTVCNEIGVSTGNMVSTGISQKMLCQGQVLFQIIKDAYEKAGLQNKKKYYYYMSGGKFNVIEYGNPLINHVIKSDTNIISSSYTQNAENVVNRVKIYDENDKYLDVVNNQTLINLLGVMQQTYTKEADKQAKTVATNMIQGIEKNIDVEILGNIECVTGVSVKVEDSATKLSGIFYIKSDTHTWSNGQHTTSLTLEFKG